MRGLFYLGWALLLGAFLACVAESMAHVQPGIEGLVLSAYDVWYTLWPGELIVTKIRIERLLGPWAWNPFFVGLLALPGWALLGLPGAFLVWLGWPERGRAHAEFKEMTDSVFLYDDLANRARAEGFPKDDPNDDSSFDLIDELEREAKLEREGRPEPLDESDPRPPNIADEGIDPFLPEDSK